MSDPVTNVEIEDVLASIRRLVSADERAAADTSKTRPRPADRLVLTPALRITDPAESAGGMEQAADPAEGKDAQDQAAPAEAGQDHAAPSDAGMPDVDTHAVDTHAVATDPVEAHDHPAPAEQPWKDPEARLYDVLRGVMEDSAGPAPATGLRLAAEAETAAPAKDAPEDDLGARIAALEKVVARTEDHWEPDTPGSDDYAGTEVEALNWDPVGGPQEPEAEPDAHVGRKADEDETDLLAEAPVLDEAALRELVADIVREELQGALGERITRNVRKLVRREIHRALTMRDLE